MKTIWKYTFDPDEVTSTYEIGLPKGAEILSLQLVEHNSMMLMFRTPRISMWYTVDTDAEPERRRFKIFVTGEKLPDDFEKLDYVGTVVLHGLVYHVVEV